MSAIPVGTIPWGSTINWMDQVKTPDQRVLVLSSSVLGHMTTLTVKSKVLKRTQTRPFEVLSVTISTVVPRDAGTEVGWVTDGSTISVALPLVDIDGSDFAARLRTLLTCHISYIAGGLSDTDLANITAIIGDNVADQLTIGLF